MKEARPTSGKVLQALFNILGDIRGKAFLDLFSGTGRVARSARECGRILWWLLKPFPGG